MGFCSDLKFLMGDAVHMPAIKWNAPTIALTVNAVLVGLAAFASLSGSDAAFPDMMKTGNIHVARAMGHELFILFCLFVGSIVNNTAQQTCLFFVPGVLVSVVTHILMDDMAGGVMNFCIAMMHVYFGLVWNKREVSKKSPIKWNAPTIALTVNAVVIGLAAFASLSGSDATFPDMMKTGNSHVARAMGHELFILFCLFVGSIVNNTAQQTCLFFVPGVLVSVVTHILMDDMAGGVMNFCIAMMHVYFGLFWKDTKVAKNPLQQNSAWIQHYAHQGAGRAS